LITTLTTTPAGGSRGTQSKHSPEGSWSPGGKSKSRLAPVDELRRDIAESVHWRRAFTLRNTVTLQGFAMAAVEPAQSSPRAVVPDIFLLIDINNACDHG